MVLVSKSLCMQVLHNGEECQLRYLDRVSDDTMISWYHQFEVRLNGCISSVCCWYRWSQVSGCSGRWRVMCLTRMTFCSRPRLCCTSAASAGTVTSPSLTLSTMSAEWLAAGPLWPWPASGRRLPVCRTSQYTSDCTRLRHNETNLLLIAMSAHSRFVDVRLMMQPLCEAA